MYTDSRQVLLSLRCSLQNVYCKTRYFYLYFDSFSFNLNRITYACEAVSELLLTKTDVTLRRFHVLPRATSKWK